jgi:tryptophan synthase alpha chain
MTLANLQARLTGRAHHFSPFFVLGDPSAKLSVELARVAVAAGASMLELGIPYRDPCADGPAIQRACTRAFEGGSTTDAAMVTVRAIAQACPGVPLNMLVYGNLVHARGLMTFCRELADAGASSLLVPDIPLGEDAGLVAACASAELGLVRLVGPRTGPDRLKASAVGATLLYAAGVQGVTGMPQAARGERAGLLDRMAKTVQLPVCAGFGISSPIDVAHAHAHGAAIAVVGSHLAEVIASNLANGEAAVLAAVSAAVQQLSVPATAALPSSSPSTTGT